MNATPCTFPACDRLAKSGGLCSGHYEQKRRGKTLNPLRDLTPANTDFWDRVDIVDDEASCWNWTAGTYGARSEYRGCYHWNGRAHAAYRVSWHLTNGPIPDGMFVCHACDNPRCVRPDHLFLGTPADNTRDMWSKGRGYRGPRSNQTGDGHHQTKITDTQVARARQLHALGVTQAELVRMTGISQSQMSRILNNESRRTTP